MFIIFIVCCIIYYSLFIAVGIDSHEPIRGFYPANIIDHYIYLENYESLKNGNVNFVGINNIGIALVYYIYFNLLELMGFIIIPEKFSLILNLFIFFMFY